MTNLIAQSPCGELLPLSIGTNALAEVETGRMTSVQPYKGQVQATSDALKKAHGMAFPDPNTMTEAADARAMWVGHGQALLIGPEPDGALAKHAALVDQSDAFAVVRLSGTTAEDVLARLVPVDLRLAQFKPGSTVRTLLGHMASSITRHDDEVFEIMVFRSMAKTLVHDLKTAMVSVAARG
ncbi:MAG: sarcosine oxidase subunit gamma [Pseudomonadota bacterium]